MPIVLTNNEVVINPEHAWRDIEGVQYHYPNQYKNLIKSGERFIYYKGVRRKQGKRAFAEYFGTGVIGEIRVDPASSNKSRPSWFCTIENYLPFLQPIPAKINGTFFEGDPNKIIWRNSVRNLSLAAYEKILAAGGVARGPTPKAAAQVQEGNDLLIPRKKVGAGSGASNGGWRKSSQAKAVGDWAEDAAIKFVRETLYAKDVVHRARIGEKPGWDFDYIDQGGMLQRVEVKGTVAAAFTSIDLTVGEYNAAKEHRQSYWIFLVAHCFTDNPVVQRVRDPQEKLLNQDWSAQSVLFNVTFGSQ
jgi:hypothetical protein